MASGRRILTAVAMLVCVAAAAGCVSMPSSGQPQPYRPSQGTGVSEQQYLQVYSEPPGAGWDPERIVEGFLAANASFAANHQVAREYLTPKVAGEWGQDWSADVFKNGPVIKAQPVAKSARTARVTVSGSLQASVKASGTYAVPGPTNTSCGTKQIPVTIDVVKTSLGWRISDPPPCLLLSASDFKATYQQRDLYFFDPHLGHLVPDPVYVPVAAARADPEDLLSGLVTDLINQPSDWLGNATTTTFPRGTSLVSVSLAGGVATVSLQGAAIGRAGTSADEQIAAQLLWTLVGSPDSQPVVTGVQLSINGKPWGPSANPVLQETQAPYAGYAPPGAAQKPTFYYLDTKGDVWRRGGPSGRPQEILPAPARGPHLTAIAVSPDGKYLAGLINGAIYTAPVGARLRSRDLTGFTSVSWDPSDDLWAAGASGVDRVPAAGGSPVMVNVASDNTITAVRVAPDGVRVALVIGGTSIEFGAIPKQTSGNTIVIDNENLSPFSVSGTGISDVTWYGPDNVIALTGGTGPHSQAMEYPVNGGSSVPVLQQPGITNIAASWDNALIASVASTANGELSFTDTIGGVPVPLGPGKSAVYPG